MLTSYSMSRICSKLLGCARAILEEILSFSGRYLLRASGRKILKRWVRSQLKNDSKRPYFVTKAWFIFLSAWIITHEPWKFLGLSFNEFGDFLAGAFAPLAFYWLVEGYRQQGKELRQNNEALLMQANELKLSVEAQQLAAEAATDQLNFTRGRYNAEIIAKKIAERPIIKVVLYSDYIEGDTQATFTFSFRILGSTPIYNVSAGFDNHVTAEKQTAYNEQIDSTEKIIVDVDFNKETKFFVLYTTPSRFDQCQELDYSLSKLCFHNNEPIEISMDLQKYK